MSTEKKRIVVDVLTQFYQANLASDSARNWIAEEIVKKLDDEKYEVVTRHPRDLENSKSMEPGLFEEYMSTIEEQNAKIAEKIEAERAKRQVEIESKVTKPTSKPKKQVTPPIDGKKVKKVKPNKNFKNIDKGKFL